MTAATSPARAGKSPGRSSTGLSATGIPPRTPEHSPSALTDTPLQTLRRQALGGVDATTGATITSQAIIDATARALAREKN